MGETNGNSDVRSKNVCIVVLGDIGRSPRMQYHALSLSKNKHKVDIIGYGETQPFTDVKKEPLISYHYLLPYPNLYIPRIINYVFKTLWQAVTLFFLMFVTRKPDVILVQNPPAIPSLAVCLLFKYWTSAKLIIDWHNYAYSIMSLTVGPNHILVKITRMVESFVGRRADANFCVTNYMKNDLSKNWNISATTLHDRPAEKFTPISLEEKHSFLNELSQKYEQLLLDDKSSNLFTKEESGRIKLNANRPGLLISSTSWTEDEDFSVLLSALEDYENHITSGNARRLPKLVCIITGKGPLKSYYTAQVEAKNWKRVTVLMPWLEDEQYPKLLASADLGVSLHTSSSGMDLPMKVVDMFGCALPVCAFDFPCLKELVLHGKNGYTFKDSQELSQQIKDWFDNFPNNENRKDIEELFKTNLEPFQKSRWLQNWENQVGHIFK